jgi:hypothetical protein
MLHSCYPHNSHRTPQSGNTYSSTVSTPTNTHLVWPPDEWVSSTARLDDVPQQVLLPVVGGEDADALCRVAHQTHEAVQRHNVPAGAHQTHSQSHTVSGLLHVYCRFGEPIKGSLGTATKQSSQRGVSHTAAPCMCARCCPDGDMQNQLGIKVMCMGACSYVD